jgi:hypothetical protein
MQWSKENGHTIQWSKEKGHTMQWSKDKGHTMQWSKDKGQRMIYKTMHRKLNIGQCQPTKYVFKLSQKTTTKKRKNLSPKITFDISPV